jgi:hypothetical protein
LYSLTHTPLFTLYYSSQAKKNAERQESLAEYKDRHDGEMDTSHLMSIVDDFGKKVCAYACMCVCFELLYVYLYTTLHYTTLHYSSLYYTTLHCTALHCTSLHSQNEPSLSQAQVLATRKLEMRKRLADRMKKDLADKEAKRAQVMHTCVHVYMCVCVCVLSTHD